MDICGLFKKFDSRNSGRISRILSSASGGPGHLSMRSTRNHHALPRLGTGRPCSSLFDLAPGGVCLAQDLSIPHGGLLHRRFTLAPEHLAAPRGGLISVALSFPFVCQRDSASLPTRTPCPMESGLSSGGRACAPRRRPAPGAPSVKDPKIRAAIRRYGPRYSIRPQKSHSVSVSALRDSTTCEGESFMWQLPQVPCSTRAIAASRCLAKIRS